MKHQTRLENIVYLAVWAVLFAAPLLTVYLRVVNGASETFSWQELLWTWKFFGVYLLLFVIHNFLLAPLLIHQHRRVLYFTMVTVMVVCFTLIQCLSKPTDLGERHPMMNRQKQMVMHHDRSAMDDGHRPPEFDDGHRPPEFDDGHSSPEHFDEGDMPRRHLQADKRLRRHRPPVLVGQHDIVAVIVLILMFGANLGVKGYFRNRNDHRRLADLERQNLAQQLEYLKYQINPHFFMNTLNNIHALVDIDPEKAKITIVELSKMMRFILYEGDKHGVPLAKEFEFIRTYIQLMRLRYTDKVSISVELPAEVPDGTVPPLMLISFVENAFKHGISYQHPSFIEVKVVVAGGRLLFTCRNSKAETTPREKGGVGLANVRKRLNLLFDNRYSLKLQDSPDVYNVELNIPLTPLS